MFTDEVALVVGGGSGIGQATALALARAGARVVIADSDERAGKGTAAQIKEFDAVAPFLSVDVRSDREVERLVAEILRVFGRLDCAVNSAGVEQEEWGLVADCSLSEWDRVMDVNLRGLWLCLKYEVPAMLAGGGSIVNVASVAGLGATPQDPVYGASKHGVVSLTRSAGRGYARSGLRVNAVCPGHIRTPMMERVTERDPSVVARWLDQDPAGRFGEPSEVAEAIVWLCSTASSFVNGHLLLVDGGLSA